MFDRIDTSFDLLLILKTTRLTQDTGLCKCFCRRKLSSSVSYNGCKWHLGFKMCIHFHMLNSVCKHSNEFYELLFREAGKNHRIT